MRLRNGKLCLAFIILPSNTKTTAVNCLISLIDKKTANAAVQIQGQAQRFLSCHGTVNNLFRLGRHLLKAPNYRTLRAQAFKEWVRVSCDRSLA
jgi:hypothetical protein